MKTLCLLITTFSALIFVTNLQAIVLEDGSAPSFVGYVPDRIVVNFDPVITERMNARQMQEGRAGIAALDRLASRFKLKSIIKQFPRGRKRKYGNRWIDLAGWHKIHFQKQVDIAKVVQAFKKLPGVIDAQPIGIHRVLRTTNDPQSSVQWHLEQIGGADINAPEAWDFESGNEDIVVAVLDTGVQYYHKDLGGSNASVYTPGASRGNMWINWAEASGTIGEDDDGNGLADDWIGWDFVKLFDENSIFCFLYDEDYCSPDNDPRDYHGHGTHVAGIVSAINNDGYAVASPAGGWGDGTRQPTANGVRIMPLRIGYESGGSGYVVMDWAAEALNYAAEMGARIVNCSWTSSDTGGLGAALDNFLATGGLVFKAAGNAGNSFDDYMGGREDIINVAATGQQDPDTLLYTDCKASFSSYGPWVDISAPGVAIWSTWYNYEYPADDYIAALDGTSMASPMAASVAALIWSQNPTWTADQVKQKLFDTADAIDGLPCNEFYAGQLGAGRVNAYLAVGSCEGDLEGSGVVDGSDLAELIGQFNCVTGCSLDVTYDDAVNAADLDVFIKDFGRTDCP